MLGRSSIAAGGWLLEKYLSRVVRSTPIEWYAPSGGDLLRSRLDTVVSYVEGLSPYRPILFPFWNAHSLLILTAYIANPALHGPLQNVQAIADDSFGGRLTQSLFRRAGLSLRLLRRAVHAERLSDIAGILTDRPDIAIAIDSHGPYKLVGVPIARLARSLGATIVPIAARSHREVRVFREIGMSVPLPTTRIAVAYGVPIECRTLSLNEIRDQITRSLVALDVRLRETSK